MALQKRTLSQSMWGFLTDFSLSNQHLVSPKQRLNYTKTIMHVIYCSFFAYVAPLFILCKAIWLGNLFSNAIAD